MEDEEKEMMKRKLQPPGVVVRTLRTSNRIIYPLCNILVIIAKSLEILDSVTKGIGNATQT